MAESVVKELISIAGELSEVFYASYGFRDQKYFDLEQAKATGESRDQVTADPNDKTALVIY